MYKLKIIIPAISNQFREQLYINEVSQSFKNLLLWIGCLIGLLIFCLRAC